jgi:hypothetical protein
MISNITIRTYVLTIFIHNFRKYKNVKRASQISLLCFILASMHLRWLRDVSVNIAGGSLWSLPAFLTMSVFLLTMIQYTTTISISKAAKGIYQRMIVPILTYCGLLNLHLCQLQERINFWHFTIVLWILLGQILSMNAISIHLSSSIK